ncbi:hypothetical protein AB0E69_07795 [Kribbella sp. NPDC026611]|uniref:hypothetical protein n=1 Tax=Kribbella sp. NPDC026611 TaxID=3154911 RepID=UPI0033D18381
MKRLLRLYPRSWQRRYVEELQRLLDDLEPMRRTRRARVAWDLVSGAADAHLREVVPATSTALRRALLIGGIVWAALTVEIVLSNVVFPSTDDNDGLSVLIAYLTIFAACTLIGVLTARQTPDWRTFALAGAVAGAMIGVLTIATFAAVDNLFITTIGRQQVKLDGLAKSGLPSMRAYLNRNLLTGLLLLPVLLSLTGGALATLGGHLAGLRRAASGGR